MPVLEFDPPDRFVAGTVGPPGQRTFFLQASSGQRLATVSLEKQQVQVLADRVNDLLDDFAGEAGLESVSLGEPDNAPLATPIEDEFRVSTLSLGWDAERQVVIVEAHEAEPESEEDDEALPGLTDVATAQGPLPAVGVFRVVVTPAQARAFARRCASLVAAGRPPCPFCGGPLDVSGHVCPRANGYKR